jgi:hypothetical protein
MNPKYRKPVILFLASFLLIGLGIVSRVNHLPAADITFGAGMIVQMFSILWLIVVIIKPVKKDKGI